MTAKSPMVSGSSSKQQEVVSIAHGKLREEIDAALDKFESSTGLSVYITGDSIPVFFQERTYKVEVHLPLPKSNKFPVELCGKQPRRGRVA